MYINNNLILNLNGDSTIYVDVFTEYQELGATANYKKNNLDEKIVINSNVNKDVVGRYEVFYKIEYKGFVNEKSREVIVVDREKPVIKLNGKEEVRTFVNEDYNDLGATASDNYDGDITNLLKVSSSVDNTKVGEYKVTYTSVDSNNNTSTIERKVNVVNRPVINNQGVAVILYHFLYSDGEFCGNTICINTKKFREQLDYLKENNFKTLTIDEFIDWMYGEIDVPEKSVLLTFDDGAMGTGKHNGNKLIPILEEYDMHATLFLITGWWSVSSYESPNLDVESHTDEMHFEGYCNGVTRGAKMLCLSKEEAKKDMETSISKLNSHKAFAYPFYAYNDTSIQILKELDFKVAFTGGGRKATRRDNKYLIPRFVMFEDTSLESFKYWVN